MECMWVDIVEIVKNNCVDCDNWRVVVNWNIRILDVELCELWLLRFEVLNFGVWILTWVNCMENWDCEFEWIEKKIQIVTYWGIWEV